MSKIINLKTWKEEHGYLPVGEWSWMDRKTGEVEKEGLLYSKPRWKNNMKPCTRKKKEEPK